MSLELSGRKLLLARLAWMIFALILVSLHLASQAAAFKELRSLTLTASQAQSLQGMRLSFNFYTAWVFAWQLPLPLAWGGMGLLIFWRKSTDWNGLLISAMMVGTGLAGSIPLWKAFMAAHPSWWWVVLIVAFAGNMCVNSFFFVFPSGRFAPRWTLGVALALSAGNILLSYDFALPQPVVAFAGSQEWLQPLFFVVVFASAILGPIYRYVWASSSVEREQMRLVVFTILVGMILFVAAASTAALLPGNNPLNGDITIFTIFVQPLGWVGVFVIIAVSIAISILRYRLFDIDLIIRRTLQYSLVTGLLALAYFGAVSLLQALFSGLTRQQTPVALVISTLLSAALFNPLRRRSQEFIDRRFYRQKYDAEKALASFAAAARNETDLELLTGRLLEIVQATLQSEKTTLWMQTHANPKELGER